ncbi:MAG: DASS family sodium-coupled anion symporter [Verrucomicrobiota bacterium JB023]|nr:DASS family sodium-coupled anion symporter [Verrucomicrobiota bacterium JB023]
MAQDTRTQARRLLGSFNDEERRGIGKTVLALLVALALVGLPLVTGAQFFAGLEPAGLISMAILLFAALLWVLEAMPAFAVGLLVIGLQIALLGMPGGVLFAPEETNGWTVFVQPWAKPTMWLFFGGFVLAQACTKTGLDRWLAGLLLGRLTQSPTRLMAGVMAVTFVFSMFMSNTATAAMMMAVAAPLFASQPRESPYTKGLVLAVALAANLGGIGTIIGTPPNAIVAAQMPAGEKLDFFKWMTVALPPAIILALLGFGLLWWLFVRGTDCGALALEEVGEQDARAQRQRYSVMVVFALTVVLWMGESIFHVSAPVVSFLPIVALAVIGVIDADDIRALPWDVLLLLAGGLSLGVGVQESGLAEWMAGKVPDSLSGLGMAMAFGLIAVVLSNLMSNTATAAMLVPLAISIAPAESVRMVLLAIALSCSLAMALPISTPPNAIVYGSGRLASRDFLLPGGVMAGFALLVPFYLKAIGL